jgi:hypothetical protein
MLLNLAVYLLLVRDTLQALRVPKTYALLACGVAVMWEPWVLSLLLGQSSVLLAALTYSAVLSERRGEHFRAGALLGLAGSIELFPLIALVYFIWAGSVRGLLGALLGFGAVVAAVFILQGSMSDWGVWWTTVLPRQLEEFGSAPGNISLTGAVRQLGHFGGDSRLIATLTVIATATFGLIAATLLAITLRSSSCAPAHIRELGLAWILVTAMLLYPVCWQANILLIVPWFPLLWESLSTPTTGAGCRSLTVAALLLSWPGFGTAVAVVQIHDPAVRDAFQRIVSGLPFLGLVFLWSHLTHILWSYTTRLRCLRALAIRPVA